MRILAMPVVKAHALPLTGNAFLPFCFLFGVFNEKGGRKDERKSASMPTVFYIAQYNFDGAKRPPSYCLSAFEKKWGFLPPFFTFKTFKPFKPFRGLFLLRAMRVSGRVGGQKHEYWWAKTRISVGENTNHSKNINKNSRLQSPRPAVFLSLIFFAVFRLFFQIVTCKRWAKTRIIFVSFL